MSNINSLSSLELKNKQLEEDLTYYKGENIHLRARIQNLEDEMRTLKDKLEKPVSSEEKIKIKQENNSGRS